MKIKLSRWIKWSSLLLLWLLFAQTVGSIPRLSVTTDEALHIARGYAYLKTGDLRLQVEHPPLIEMLEAAPLLLAPDLPAVATVKGWDDADYRQFSKQLILKSSQLDRLVFLARAPVALLSLLLAALVLRWARDLGGTFAGLVALAWYAFDPNIVAHSSLATNDLGVACGVAFAAYAMYRLLNNPSRRWVVLAGVALGAALVSKMIALMALPVLAIWALAHGWNSDGSLARRMMPHHSASRPRKLAAAAVLLIGVCLVAGVTVWAVYRFEVKPLPGVPVPVPAATHFKILLRNMGHLDTGHLAFLAGSVSDRGWWYYFPVAMAIKTPLPTLALLAPSLFLFWRHPRRFWLGALVLYPVFYFAVATTGSVNIGYRHLLSTLPFLFVVMGVQIAACFSLFASRLSQRTLARSPHRLVSWLAGLLILALFIWYVAGTVSLFPNDLAFFNELVGGPDGGYRYLADSNTDWGQAQKELAAWQRAQGIERVNLSLFTFVDPAVYGVRYNPLPPMNKTDAILASRFNPPPGDYVISATTLQGIPLADPEMYDWFRKRQPDDRIGHVMLVYHVPPPPQREWVAECTTPVAPLQLEQLAEGLGRADLRLAYFDCSTSWLYPTGGRSPGWVALASDAAVGNERWLQSVRQSYEQKQRGFASPFRLYQDDGRVTLPAGGRVHVAPSALSLVEASSIAPIDLPITFEGGLTLLGYTLDRPTLKPGEAAHLETVWRVDGAPARLLSLMAHALGPDGRVVVAGDGLGVPIESWQPGDVFVQRHTLTVPQDTPPGALWLQTGVYWLDGQERWPARAAGATGDRVLLTTIEVLSK